MEVSSMEKLYIYLKEGDGFQFLLKTNTISVGRSHDNDIPLSDPFCSGHHAVLNSDKKSYTVRDNNSKNGTFLNGKRIQDETKLKKGDEMLIGTTRIVYDKKSSSRNH
jgi:pSer/pThr/pTyr-binding forkhead associated (FHA) protein